MLRVDADALHGSEVDDEAIVAGAETRHAVAAAADGQQDVVVTREGHRRHHVGCVDCLDDQAGPAVVHGVVDRSCRVEPIVARPDQRAAKLRSESLDLFLLDVDVAAVTANKTLYRHIRLLDQ